MDAGDHLQLVRYALKELKDGECVYSAPCGFLEAFLISSSIILP